MAYGPLPNTGGTSLIYLLVGLFMMIGGAFMMAARSIKSLFTSGSGSA